MFDGLTEGLSNVGASAGQAVQQAQQQASAAASSAASAAQGAISEAQTAAAVLGHNYPNSSWYKQAYELLQKQGVSPQINPGSSLAQLRRT